MIIKKIDNEAREKAEVLKNLFLIQKSLEVLYKNYDYVTDESLIDSYIYDINSLNKKYSYYLKICKDNSVTAKDYQKI
ncbi:MAG: DUF2508 family protein [Lachnospirales bacterium]